MIALLFATTIDADGRINNGERRGPLSEPGVKERAATIKWFRGGNGQLRGLIVVSLILVLAGGVTVFGSATALTQLTDSLAMVAREQAANSARLACQEIKQVARACQGKTLAESAKSPELRRHMEELSSRYDIVLASLVNLDGEVLSHYYCNHRLGQMSPENASAVQSPTCVEGKSLDVIPAGFLPDGIVPVQEEIWRHGELLGYVRVFGVSGVDASSRIDPLVGRIGSILSFMVLLVFGILMLALAVIYWTMLRQAELLKRAANAEQMAEIGALAGGLAHEVRNPLQTMGIHLDMAREELEENDPSRFDRASMASGLALVQEQSHRLATLVDNFSRMARSGRLRREQVDLASICRETVGRLASNMEKEGIELKASLPETLPFETDPSVVAQVLDNLLSRSRETIAKSTERRVFLSASAVGSSHVQFEVEDTGPCLTEEDARTIFEPFVDGDLGRRCLALSMTRRMVETLGGTITSHPGTNGGARFVVTLPILPRN
ncbi:MAG: HAMP domain-containing histidine kinase [Candidatus Sumerlaeia bacterium]|nr:HAMP domain-containing histidine kinase [Candidatus Sumerlaeia bacterium]